MTNEHAGHNLILRDVEKGSKCCAVQHQVGHMAALLVFLHILPEEGFEGGGFLPPVPNINCKNSHKRGMKAFLQTI